MLGRKCRRLDLALRPQFANVYGIELVREVMFYMAFKLLAFMGSEQVSWLYVNSRGVPGCVSSAIWHAS